MTNSLKIIFAGTPEFAAVALKALFQSQHQVIAVYTQPDRPAGRGQKLTASPVKILALQHQVPIFQPETLKEASQQHTITALQADLMVVAAYGLILPLAVLEAPALGCINIHASLLPRWRGAAPIQRAILAGDSETGITIMQMAKGLDTGPILYKQSCPITAIDTSQTLHDKLSQLGAEALLTTLQDLSAYPPIPQDKSLVTYAEKIAKPEAKINWDLSAAEIDRCIRAFNPWPIAFTTCDGDVVRVWQALPMPGSSFERSGTILAASNEGIDIQAGNQTMLRIQKLQLPGGKVLTAKELLNSRQKQFAIGKILG